MRRRYILAPEAARDLVAIWNYIRDRDTPQAADRATSVIRSKIAFLATTLIVYRPSTRPLQVVSILHGNRNLERLLAERL